MNKRIMALLLVLMLVFSLCACSQPAQQQAEVTEAPTETNAAVTEPSDAQAAEAGSGDAAGQPSDELSYDFTLGYSVIGEGNSFLVTVNDGIREACEKKV